MKVKKVLSGLLSRYDIEELNIISTNKVIYSGPVGGFITPDVDMLPYKKAVENLEVTNKMMFNGRKAFIFTPDVGVYYPGK